MGLLVAFHASVPLAQAQMVLSDEAQLSLLTIMPGDAAYSMFGHSAIRVYDPIQDIDTSFNYGTFTFGNPLVFIGQFAYGKLDYALSIQSFTGAMHGYRLEDRPVVEQVLNLSPGQQQAIFDFLRINALPENRYYRYDFFFDNCATRIRDVFEDVLGNAVHLTPADPGLTFRQLIDLYAVEKPFLDAGMDMGLGLPADRIATPHETMFLPDYLHQAFDGATITIDGSIQPLVTRTDTMAWSIESAPVEPAWPWPAIIGWLLFGLGLVLTVLDVRDKNPSRRIFDSFLFGVIGLAGVLVVFLWFISLHTVTQHNLNLLWAWPTHLILFVVLRRRWEPSWLWMYLAATALATLILVLGWPFWAQALPPVVLPLVLLILMRSGWLAAARWRVPRSRFPVQDSSLSISN
ncbi:MAG TPA: DUF4105 domain-containing protein [Rhodothermales bacterium]|nr:DUF4105 domain-containing protein [Rhodothermales bacterium]